MERTKGYRHRQRGTQTERDPDMAMQAFASWWAGELFCAVQRCEVWQYVVWTRGLT